MMQAGTAGAVTPGGPPGGDSSRGELVLHGPARTLLLYIAAEAVLSKDHLTMKGLQPDIKAIPCAGVPPDDDQGEAAEVRRNVMKLHVLLLRIALRLGENPRSSIVQQVVYR